jgi:hypothetical protein
MNCRMVSLLVSLAANRRPRELFPAMGGIGAAGA